MPVCSPTAASTFTSWRRNPRLRRPTYLLWHGKLPNKAELTAFPKQLADARKLPPQIVDLLKSFPPKQPRRWKSSAPPSPRSASTTRTKRPSTTTRMSESRFDLTAQIAMIVAAFDRIRKGKDVVAPDPSLSHAGNFLWMLTGEKPSETATRAFDVALILHADHELNASTFAARVIAATLSDIHSAITGAIGALKGPLHGGANEAVMRMLYAIDKEGADPVEYVQEMLAQKKKVSGFGHRVYHTEDPARHAPTQDVRRPRPRLGQSKMV